MSNAPVACRYAPSAGLVRREAMVGEPVQVWATRGEGKLRAKLTPKLIAKPTMELDVIREVYPLYFPPEFGFPSVNDDERFVVTAQLCCQFFKTRDGTQLVSEVGRFTCVAPSCSRSTACTSSLRWTYCAIPWCT